MSCRCGKSYIVKQGDILFDIAQRELGDGNRWREIMNPDCSKPVNEIIFPGQELCLPNGSPGSQINLEATFYDVQTTGCSFPATGVFGITLRAALEGRFEPRCPNTGENVPRVQCAVASSQIPLRKQFTLVLWDDRQVSAEALDVGSAIVPGRIDILVDTVQEAIDLGVKSVTAIL